LPNIYKTKKTGHNKNYTKSGSQNYITLVATNILATALHLSYLNNRPTKQQQTQNEHPHPSTQNKTMTRKQHTNINKENQYHTKTSQQTPPHQLNLQTPHHPYKPHPLTKQRMLSTWISTPLPPEKTTWQAKGPKI